MPGQSTPAARAINTKSLPRCLRRSHIKKSRPAPRHRSAKIEWGLRSAPVLDIHIIPLGLAGIELAGAADLAVLVLQHLLPLRDPADRAAEREDRREHGSREAHRFENDARIEIDIRVELLLDEIAILERPLLERLRDLQDGVVLDPKQFQHL